MYKQVDYYRADNRTKDYPMSQIYYNDMYNPEHPIVNDPQTYHHRQNHQNNLSRIPGRNRQTFHQTYHNQQQYYYNKSSGHENYGVIHPGYAHYNYSGSTYSNESPENMTTSVPVNHESSTTYYPNETMQPVTKVQNPEYQNKVGYYDNSSTYNSNHLPPNSDSTYGITPEVFPGTNNSTTGIMTPPASVHTDNSDNHTNFHQFYGGGPHAPVGHPGEGSNSSSDFNFLNNLANDYTPEYYQI